MSASAPTTRVLIASGGQPGEEMAQALSRAGFKVLLAALPADAVSHMADWHPEAVLFSPELISVERLLQATRTPGLMLQIGLPEGDRAWSEARQTGVDDFLDPETSAEVVIHRLRNMVSARRLWADQVHTQSRRLVIAGFAAALSAAEDEREIMSCLADALEPLMPSRVLVLWVPPDAAPALWCCGSEQRGVEADEQTLMARMRLEQEAPSGLTPKHRHVIERAWPLSGLGSHLVCHPLEVEGLIRGMLALRTTRSLSTDEHEQLRRVVALLGPPLERIRQMQGLARANEELGHAAQALRRTQADVVSAERMSVLGQLATGVAHELNNPLAYVKSNIDVMRHYVEALSEVISLHARGDHEGARAQAQSVYEQGVASELSEVVQETMDGAERAHKIVRALKNFGPDISAGPVKIAPKELIGDTLHMLHGDLSSRAVPRPVLYDCPTIFGNPARLRQALMCLLTNAAQAIPGERDGRIEVRCRPEGGGVCIEVEDNGEGIADAEQARIFEPFYTTRTAGSGCGLGLSIVKEVAQSHGGRVEVRSIPGEGSVFTLWVPEYRAEGVRSRRTVLCIDGDQASLNAYHRAYSQLARIILARGSAAGIAALEQEPVIDAVICDVQMPDEAGLRVHRWLAEHRPDLRSRFVAATSGVVGDEIRRFIDTAGVPVLYKPFSMSDLGRVIGRVSGDDAQGAAGAH